MIDKGSNPHDPHDWIKEDHPATEDQEVYLDALIAQSGEPAPEGDLSRTEAANLIEELREETGDTDTLDAASDDDLTMNRDK